MEKKKKITIAIIIIAVIIGGIALFKFLDVKAKNNEIELDKLKEQKIQLEVRKNEVFFSEGFNEEYYHLENEIKEINQKINEKELSSGPSAIFFTIFGLIFVTIFGTAVITIFRGIKNHNNIEIPNISVDDHAIKQMEKMTTMLGKVAVDMAKEMNPEYKSLKCPNCGAALTDDIEVCEYCNAPLTKVVATGNKK